MPLVDINSPVEIGPQPFVFDHGLVGHPLFEDERLVAMLQRLPRERIEIRRVPTRGQQHEGFGRVPLDTESDPVKVFRELPECPAWMLIHKLKDFDFDYEVLRRSMLRAARAALPDLEPETDPIGCMMFLSSGSVVVHFHADPDTSFLNQVRGSKTLYTYPAQLLDETVIEELARTHDQGAIRYHDAFEDKMFEPIRLTPGKSAYLPHYAPHRVTNDADLSVSFNVGFRPRRNRHRRRVHLANARLRKLGLPVHAFGDASLADRAKEIAHFGFAVVDRVGGRLKQYRSR